MASARIQEGFRVRLTMNQMEDRSVPAVVPPTAVVVGSDEGAPPLVRVVDSETGKPTYEFQAFDVRFTGGVRVATGDVTGDDVPDLIAAAGRGGGPHIQVLDGETGQIIRNLFVYEPNFTGGLRVAVGDINGDGIGDIIVGAGEGGGPRITSIDVSGDEPEVIHDFFAYESAFRGGVNVAAADFNKDGFDDYVVGTGRGGGPRVVVYSGKDPSVVLHNFFAYDHRVRDGVDVTAADTNGDGTPDIVVGTGYGSAPHVRVISGVDLGELGNFFAFDPTLKGGARVATVDVDGDDRSEIIVGTPGHIRRFLKLNDPSAYLDLNGVDVSTGVFVGGTGDDKHRGKDHDDDGFQSGNPDDTKSKVKTKTKTKTGDGETETEVEVEIGHGSSKGKAK